MAHCAVVFVVVVAPMWMWWLWLWLKQQSPQYCQGVLCFHRGGRSPGGSQYYQLITSWIADQLAG